jgi:hypothetical protein
MGEQRLGSVGCKKVPISKAVVALFEVGMAHVDRRLQVLEHLFAEVHFQLDADLVSSATIEGLQGFSQYL